MCNLSEGVLERGMRKGIEQGIEKGVEKTKLEVALEMLSDGTFSLTQIARISKLPMEKLAELAKNLDKKPVIN